MSTATNQSNRYPFSRKNETKLGLSVFTDKKKKNKGGRTQKMKKENTRVKNTKKINIQCLFPPKFIVNNLNKFIAQDQVFKKPITLNTE